eukprot:g16177.t1
MSSVEEELAQIRARRQRAQMTQQNALLNILGPTLKREPAPDGPEPAEKKAKADAGDSAAAADDHGAEAEAFGTIDAIMQAGGASSSTALAVPPADADLQVAIPQNAPPKEDLEWLQDFRSMVRKMEQAQNFKHALKVFEKIWLHRERRIPYVELCEFYSILFTKPLTMDIIQLIDRGHSGSGGDMHSVGDGTASGSGKGAPRRKGFASVANNVKPTARMQIRNKAADSAASGPEFVELKYLLKPLEIGLTQNIKSKSTADVVKALYAVIKVHLLDVPYQNRQMFEPSTAEKNCILKLRELIAKSSPTSQTTAAANGATGPHSGKANSSVLKTLSARTISMVLYCFALVCNQNFVSNPQALAKLALDRGVLRSLYADVLHGNGIASLDSAQLCELAYSVSKWNLLYTQVLCSTNKLSAAHGLGIAHREPLEERVFHAISARVAQIAESVPLKHLSDLVAVFAFFGLKDEDLFNKIAPLFLKGKSKMSDHDFQQVLKAYIKFNLPLREQAVGFRTVAIMGKGDFTRPSDKPKKQKFQYQRPEALQDR